MRKEKGVNMEFSIYLVREYTPSGRFIQQIYKGPDAVHAIDTAQRHVLRAQRHASTKVFGLITPSQVNLPSIPKNRNTKAVYKPAFKPVHLLTCWG